VPHMGVRELDIAPFPCPVRTVSRLRPLMGLACAARPADAVYHDFVADFAPSAAGGKRADETDQFGRAIELRRLPVDAGGSVTRLPAWSPILCGTHKSAAGSVRTAGHRFATDSITSADRR
jgi:hypothetical protein